MRKFLLIIFLLTTSITNSPTQAKLSNKVTSALTTALIGNLNGQNFDEMISSAVESGGSISLDGKESIELKGITLDSGKNTSISSEGNVLLTAGQTEQKAVEITSVDDIDGIKESTKRQAVVTDINTGGNLTISSGGVLYSEGSQLDITGDANINAEQVIMESAKDISNSSFSGSESTVTETTSVQESKFKLEHKKGYLNVGGNLKIKSDNGVRLQGYDLEAKGDSDIDTGAGKLEILATKDIDKEQKIKKTTGNFFGGLISLGGLLTGDGLTDSWLYDEVQNKGHSRERVGQSSIDIGGSLDLQTEGVVLGREKKKVRRQVGTKTESRYAGKDSNGKDIYNTVKVPVYKTFEVEVSKGVINADGGISLVDKEGKPKDLTLDDILTYQNLIATNESWNDTTRTLNAEAVLAIQIAVAYATGGMGASAIGATAGGITASMANAAVTSALITGAIGSINSMANGEGLIYAELGEEMANAGFQSAKNAAIFEGLLAGAGWASGKYDKYFPDDGNSLFKPVNPMTIKHYEALKYWWNKSLNEKEKSFYKQLFFSSIEYTEKKNEKK